MITLIGFAIGLGFILIGWWMATKTRRKGPPKGFVEQEPPFP